MTTTICVAKTTRALARELSDIHGLSLSKYISHLIKRDSVRCAEALKHLRDLRKNLENQS